jgi:hypothetical protein
MARKVKVNGGREESAKANITVNVTEEPVYYINYAEVTNTPNDFSILGTRLPAKPSDVMISDLKKGGSIVLDALVQIVFPVSMIPGLIRALQTRKDMYEKFYKTTIKEPGTEDE